MKKANIIIYVFLLVICTVNLSAQLKVVSDGRVRAGGGTTSPGASFEVQEHNETTEARIFATSANIARIWAMAESTSA